jgi:hypothetical protein
VPRAAPQHRQMFEAPAPPNDLTESATQSAMRHWTATRHLRSRETSTGSALASALAAITRSNRLQHDVEPDNSARRRWDRHSNGRPDRIVEPKTQVRLSVSRAADRQGFPLERVSPKGNQFFEHVALRRAVNSPPPPLPPIIATDGLEAGPRPSAPVHRTLAAAAVASNRGLYCGIGPSVSTLDSYRARIDRAAALIAWGRRDLGGFQVLKGQFIG